MSKIFLLLLLVIVTSAAPDPYVYSSPFYSSPYTIPVAVPASPTETIATVPTISAAYPFSMSSYILGYNVQDISLVSPPSAPLVAAPYTSFLPYAYATDYIYSRK